MQSGFRLDTEENRCLTLKQTKNAALNALQEYEVIWSSVRFIQISEHATFRIESGEDERFFAAHSPVEQIARGNPLRNLSG